ncbi:MAG: glycosyltransferase family 2 protein [Candidatus Sumerlaeaceae bacterium]|nr:glycosyltransferase family 2 protein [Candidatus Sumerlaeaceae bacterium]
MDTQYMHTGTPWDTVLLVCYYTCFLIVSLYGVHRLVMLYLFFRYRHRKPRSSGPPGGDWPRVTVQLPIYNERFVVRRLLESIAALDYPRDRLDVQVLDDSTDSTTQIAEDCVRRLRAQGLDVSLVRRPNRNGYKAGALQNGLATAKGEFIAIFDADFLPAPEFLRVVLPHFSDCKVGMVQVRWDHVNRGYSLLTRLQSVLLDGHLAVESPARFFSGRFFNFNGTAGVWRRQTIEDAGGWQHDTLTEDLDLSYRAQLRGWKFIFLSDHVCPAELPVEMNAFKTQQHRWTKGAVETALKLLPTVWRAQIPFLIKLEATVHLTSNFAYLLMVLVCLLLWPVIQVREDGGYSIPAWIDLLMFVFATLSVIAFYAIGQQQVTKDWVKRLQYIPLMMSLGIGLCINNGKAVLEALLGRKSSFVRTPKVGVEQRGDRLLGRYSSLGGVAVTAAELMFAAYYAAVAADCILSGNYLTIPFVLLFLFGFSYVGGLSLWSLLRRSAVVSESTAQSGDGVEVPVTQ